MTTVDRLVNGAVVLLSIAAIGSVSLAVKRNVASPPRQPEIVHDRDSLAADRSRLGPESSKVTVVMFSDIRCVHCKHAWRMLMAAQRQNPSEVAIVYRHSPLSIDYAADAARAAECALRERRLTELFDIVHDSTASLSFSDSLSRGKWTFAARRAGIKDTAAFAKCMDATEVQRQIEEDIALASKVQVYGVPTMYVNGRQVRGTDSVRLRRLIADAKEGK